jgi:NADPH:quinone reductase
VLSTVSSPDKAALARAAGAEHVVNYRTDDVPAAVRAIVPAGVDLVVEVDPAANADLDQKVIATAGTVAIYAATAESTSLPTFPAIVANIRYQFVLVYTVPAEVKAQAVADVTAAVAAGALRVGEAAGLPLHRYPLAATADAHTAVQEGAVGKVLIDV